MPLVPKSSGMNQYAIPALKDKRAELAGKVVSLRKQIAKHTKELASIDATIRVFDPFYKIGSIKPRYPRKRSKLFKQGQLGLHIIDALRRTEGAPLTTHEVITAVLAAIGEGEASRAGLTHSVRSNLTYLERRRAVVKIGEKGDTRWRLV